jgi:ABC-type dipeptide/oligopeptide/nickel transport systems, permease components
VSAGVPFHQHAALHGRCFAPYAPHKYLFVARIIAGLNVMLNFIVKRLFGLLPTLFIVAVLVFLFVHLLPGDPARSRPVPKRTRRPLRWCVPISASISRCRSNSPTSS